MTGYGRSDVKTGHQEVTIEIRSVNNRYRDIVIKAPHYLGGIEDKIRKYISSRLSRGRIEVFIRISGQSDAEHVILDEKLALSYIQALEKLKSLDTMISQNIDLALVARFPDVMKVSEDTPDNEVLWEMVSPALSEALDQLEAARKAEGDNLKKDVALHQGMLQDGLEKIQQLAPEAMRKSVESLKSRIREAMKETGADEARIAQEASLLADRLAIDEEMARLDSHLKRLTTMLDTREPVGRRLDFLAQELNREINTIGSKTDCVDIIDLVVEMKGETEKIREQVQNIE